MAKKYFLFQIDFYNTDMMTIEEIKAHILGDPSYGYLKKDRKKEFERMKSKGWFDDEEAYGRFK